MRREGVRRLLLAVVASLLAHLVLLVRVYPGVPVRIAPAGKPLEAVIGTRSQTIPSHAAGPKAPAPVGVPPPSRMTARSDGSTEHQRQVTAPRVVVPSAVMAPAAVGKAAPEQAAEAPVGAAPTVATRDGVSADDLRQYRVALAIAARRFKRYPPVARESLWEGTAEVAVSMSAWGHVPELSLVRSSGRAVLDTQAMLMIEQAAAATTPPEALRGREFRVLLPIEFSLDPGH